MKYYKIEIKSFYKNDMIATNAEGKYIKDGAYYFDKMDKGEKIVGAPVFDYFYLESFDKKEYWEWMIADAHKFIGEGSQIPGWLVSEKLKVLLGNFNIIKPHYFYSSKLLYKEEKLNYFTFNFSGDNFIASLVNYINFKKSLFFDPNQNINFKIESIEDLGFQTSKIFKESDFEIVNIPIHKLCIKDELDFFPMQNFLGDIIVSERLKKAMEENEITGFEFSELDYEVLIDN